MSDIALRATTDADAPVVLAVQRAANEAYRRRPTAFCRSIEPVVAGFSLP